MIEQIRRDIQALIDELLKEVDRLRRALAALTSRASEPDRSGRAAPVAGSAADESAAKTPRARAGRTPRTSEKPASSAAAPARTRTAPGATKAAVLAALKDGSAMTAGEIAATTGLGRATVSTTLSKLATSGEITKATRGYQLPGESDTAPVEGAGEAGGPD
jgi:DNA-binding IclR family transcriptional regulator